MQQQPQQRRQPNRKERRDFQKSQDKLEKKLRVKQHRLINKNRTYFKDIALAQQLPLGFKVEGGGVTVESNEELYLELLKDVYKHQVEYNSVSFFANLAYLFWFLVIVLKCYVLKSFLYFLLLIFGLFFFHRLLTNLSNRMELFGGMKVIDAFFHLHVARIFGTYLDAGTYVTLSSYSEQFFLITVQGFFSIVFALLICQFLMRTIFSTLPFHLLDSPPKMKLYYDIIIVVSCLHFFYALYITYEIIFQLNEDYLTSWW